VLAVGIDRAICLCGHPARAARRSSLSRSSWRLAARQVRAHAGQLDKPLGRPLGQFVDEALAMTAPPPLQPEAAGGLTQSSGSAHRLGGQGREGGRGSGGLGAGKGMRSLGQGGWARISIRLVHDASLTIG